MARNTATDRRTAGTALLVALVVLVGTPLVAGPALAQETTDDGMDGNDTTDDGMDGNDTMTDESMGTETEVGNGSMDDGESMADDGSMDDGNESMEDEMAGDDEEMTGDEMTDGEMSDGETRDEGDEAGMTEETNTGGQSGFGVAAGVAALVVGVAFVLYRRRG